MKGMDIFCASPASTAICSSVDHRAMVRHGHTRRHITRQNSNPIFTPCSTELPILPKVYGHHEKSRKSTSSKPDDLRRKSSADIDDLKKSPHGGSSRRYLLSDKPFIDWLSETNNSDHRSALVPAPAPAPQTAALKPPKPKPIVSSNNNHLLLKSSSTPHKPRTRDQVVVLRVSIHCKGCEGKVRKHISKMEGVTSFNIDLASKTVTVVGDVTPLGVLASISQVKKAQLWPYSATAAPASAPVSPAVKMIRY